jgi:hypothetical protein
MQNNLRNEIRVPALTGRDVKSGDFKMIGIVRRSAATTVPAVAATAVSSSSDEMLVARIANGDKLAMQVLFARHRTPVYRWLLRFVGNETVAEGLRPLCALSNACRGSRVAPRTKIFGND